MSCALVAVLMANQAKARELAEQLAVRGVRPFVAKNSDELYEKMGEETVDVLVIANQLQGFLSGLEITERMQADFAQPVTVLLAPESVREQPAVRHLRIFQVESPNAAVETLAEITTRAVEKALLNRPFVCPRAQRLVARIEDLQPLPPLMLKIAASLRDAPAAPETLFADIAADPVASAAVLRIVNSSAMGRSQKTTNVAEAIHFLGLRRTVSAVLSAGWMQTQNGLLARAPKELRRWYMRRSVLIASVAEACARNLEELPPELAYIHGLLQDTGILVFAQAHGPRYVQLLERVEEIPHLRLDAEERYLFGTSHADVTAALVRKLKLPESLATISGRHHAPIADPQGSLIDQALGRVMQIGEAVANIADRATPQRQIMLTFLLGHYHGRPAGLCIKTLLEAIQRVAELSQVLGLPSPDDHVLAQLAENVRLHGQYVPGADFDPYQLPPRSEPATEALAEPDLNASSAAEGETAAPATGIQPAQQAAGAARLLVLEDDAAIARFVSGALKDSGIEVVHAAHIRDALAVMPRVDAVLCDVHLGNEDGIRAIAELRSQGFTGPVLVISGDGCRSTVERACKAKVSEYLLKPFSKSQLLEKLLKYPALSSRGTVRPPKGLSLPAAERLQNV